MRSCQEAELEDMAIAAELARQLCHEFSNFLHGLFLQLEIEAAGPRAQAWQGLKQEGKQIVRLLHEWALFNSRFSFDEAMIDLHEIVRQVAEDRRQGEHVLHLAPAITSGPLSIAGSAVAVRHLVRLLAEEAFRLSEQTMDSIPDVLVETEQTDAGVNLRLLLSPPAKQALSQRQVAAETAAPESLAAHTCRSLLVRLGASLEHQRQSDGRWVIQVMFPVKLMSAR